MNKVANTWTNGQIAVNKNEPLNTQVINKVINKQIQK